MIQIVGMLACGFDLLLDLVGSSFDVFKNADDVVESNASQNKKRYDCDGCDEKEYVCLDKGVHPVVKNGIVLADKDLLF